MTFSYLFFSFTLHLMTYSAAEDWCYDIQAKSKPSCEVPSQWYHEYQYCAQTQQSPIDINTCHAKFDSSLTPFKFKGYDIEREYQLKNNGHSAVLNLSSKDAMEITGGGLLGPYVATQLHFHWGSENKSGSEHHLNGHQFPIELHIVHEKKDRSTRGMDIAVLGFFYEEGSRNDNYNNLIKAFEAITVPAPENSTDLRVKLQDLIPNAEHLKLFYRYNGSLTTPHCNETVTWTLFNTTIKLDKSQIDAFSKNLNYSKTQAMTDNFRPIQNRNGRTILTSGVDARLPNSRYLLITLFVFYLTLIRDSVFTFNSC